MPSPVPWPTIHKRAAHAMCAPRWSATAEARTFQPTAPIVVSSPRPDSRAHRTMPTVMPPASRSDAARKIMSRRAPNPRAAASPFSTAGVEAWAWACAAGWAVPGRTSLATGIHLAEQAHRRAHALQDRDERQHGEQAEHPEDGLDRAVQLFQDALRDDGGDEQEVAVRALQQVARPRGGRRGR